MTLQEKQFLFPQLVAKLIGFIYSQGYTITFGEAWRSPETAKIYADEGKGIVNSLHCQRLAIDLCLFKDGVYLTNNDSYKFAGDFWKLQSNNDYIASWGGDFGDADHFSISHNGTK